MRIGVVILPEYSWAEAAPRWKSLQDRGFAHGWTFDHLAWRTLADHDWFATMPTLAAVAAVTDTLRIGTWVATPTYRHPVTFAKELMTLDNISGGRLIAGFGAGTTGHDARVLGQPVLPPRERMDRLVEFVELVDTLLRQPETTASGQYYDAVSARMNPAGSRSRIPIMIAADGPRGLALAARYDAWVTTGAKTADDDMNSWWRRIAGLAARFDDLTAAAGGDQDPMQRFVNLEAAPRMVLSSVESFVDAAGRAAELGFTDAVVPWPRAEGIYAGDEAVLDAVADLLTDGALR